MSGIHLLNFDDIRFANQLLLFVNPQSGMVLQVVETVSLFDFNNCCLFLVHSHL